RLVVGTQRVLQGRVVRRLDLELPLVDPPGAAEQAARRRAGGALAVGVINAAVARAHEQAGLRKPGHRTAEVGAVDGEDEELILLLLVLALVADVDAGLA